MPDPEFLASQLLKWYGLNARDLPWRRTTDPYAIWISEIMLQQTQVQTVIPYWERWMKALPDVGALATAGFDQVLKLWEGLGYYTRAKHLHSAAQAVVEHHNGLFPRKFESVHALPGIGRYTAGAICSIAYNQPTPILDGNVIRVLARVYGIAGNVRAKDTSRRLWQLSQELVDRAAALPQPRPCAALNQALMELGATICSPRQPKCPACPVHKQCTARRTNRVNELPELGKRPQATERRFVAFVAQRGGKVLVQRRPAGVVNAQLWEFPNLETNRVSCPLEKAAEHCLGWKPSEIKPLCTVLHTITRYRIHLDAYVVAAPKRQKANQSSRWEPLDQLETLAFPSAHRRIARVIQQAAADKLGS